MAKAFNPTPEELKAEEEWYAEHLRELYAWLAEPHEDNEEFEDRLWWEGFETKPQ